ncbi:AMP-binding protein [Corynebacterium marquesiae]
MIQVSPNFSVEDYGCGKLSKTLNAKEIALSFDLSLTENSILVLDGEPTAVLVWFTLRLIESKVPFVFIQNPEAADVQQSYSDATGLLDIKLSVLKVLPDSIEHQVTVGTQPLPQENETLCFFMTSGTTGQPRMIEFTSNGVMNALTGLVKATGKDCWSGRVLQSNACEFDAFLEELLLTAIYGGVLVIPHIKIIDAIYSLDDVFEQYSIDTIDIPTGVFNAFTILSGKRVNNRQITVVIGGQAYFPPALRVFKQIFPNSLVVNSYGPTEATITCAAYVLEKGSTRQIVGFPYPNVDWRICHQGNRDSIGELLLSGIQVKNLCQANDPSNSFSHTWFKTGDLVRETEEGLEYISRCNDVEKIAGLRVNLSIVSTELEALLNQRVWLSKESSTSGIDMVKVSLIDVPKQKRSKVAKEVKMYLQKRGIPSMISFQKNIPLSKRGKEVSRFHE